MHVTAHDRITTEQVAPTEIEAGDVVIDGSALLRVISEPQTMHSGLGLFDAFRVMIRAELEDIQDGRLLTRRWELDEVLVRRLRHAG